MKIKRRKAENTGNEKDMRGEVNAGKLANSENKEEWKGRRGEKRGRGMERCSTTASDGPCPSKNLFVWSMGHIAIGSTSIFPCILHF